MAYSGSAALLCWAGWAWLSRARSSSRQNTSPARTLGQLDATSRLVLRTVAEREPFTPGEIPGVPRLAALYCLDRLSAIGVLKCELTVAAGEAEGTTVWSVFPEFKEAALGAPVVTEE